MQNKDEKQKKKEDRLAADVIRFFKAVSINYCFTDIFRFGQFSNTNDAVIFRDHTDAP